MAKAVWTAAQQAEVARRRRLRLLFEGQHETYFVLPSGEERRYEYVTVNWLGDVLSQTWKRLLFRQFPTLTSEQHPEALEALEEQLALPELALPTALMVSWAGRAVWKCYWSRLSQAPVLELWGKRDGEVAFLETLPTDPSRPVAVDFWYSLRARARGDSQERVYWVRERHELLVDRATGAVSGTRMMNTAHRDAGGPVDEVVPLAEVWPGDEPPEEERVTPGLTVLPVVVVENVDRDGDRRGDTDYSRSLISLQKNVNKLVASRQFVIDTSEEPNIQIPQEYLDENGEVDWARVKLRIRYEGDGEQPIDISSWTGNLQNSQQQWADYRREFMALTGIAPALFGQVEGTGGESGYARRLGMVPTEAEVGARRRCWEMAFRQAFVVAQAVAGAYGGTRGEPLGSVSVSWPPAIPAESAEVSLMVTQELREGARSLRSAVERLNPDWTQEQVDAEVAAIESESQARRALAVPDLGNPFGGL